MEIVDILKAYFGYENFRGKQEEIINSIINKKGVLAIMATGSGKSICFQIPGLYFEGLTIVISPLISLIVDQVRELKQKQISAAFLIGDMTSLAIREVYQLIMKKQLKFLYLSPERLVNQEFLKIISSSLVSQVVVDEAHCISMWGKDFRKSYQEIPLFLANLNSNPIVSAVGIGSVKAHGIKIIFNINQMSRIRFIIGCLPGNNNHCHIDSGIGISFNKMVIVLNPG